MGVWFSVLAFYLFDLGLEIGLIVCGSKKSSDGQSERRGSPPPSEHTTGVNPAAR
jgi:hypothetical protein